MREVRIGQRETDTRRPSAGPLEDRGDARRLDSVADQKLRQLALVEFEVALAHEVDGRVDSGPDESDARTLSAGENERRG